HRLCLGPGEQEGDITWPELTEAAAGLSLERRLVDIAGADRGLDPSLAQQLPASGGGGCEDQARGAGHRTTVVPRTSPRWGPRRLLQRVGGVQVAAVASQREQCYHPACVRS